MGIEFIILIVIVIAGFAGIFWFLTQKKEEPIKDDGMQNMLLMLQNQISQMTNTVDAKLGESAKTVQHQFSAMQSQSSEMGRLVRDITQELTKVGEGQKQVAGFADQLRNLQDILKNPKQRGILGEYYLETVLKNVLPPGRFEIQYNLGKDDLGHGLIVDAVVFVKDKIIPIDSKFSLENYERILITQDSMENEKLQKLFKQDLKNRIDETSKYIRPEMNTMDFAFMFIPSEAIYYDLLVNKVGAVQVSTQDLIEYAFKEKHVIIVSPTSFLAYLQTVLQGLRALQIEDSAKEIRKNVEQLQKHLINYESFMQKLGNQLGTVVNTYNATSKEFKKVDKDVYRITGEKSGIEAVVIAAPQEELI